MGDRTRRHPRKARGEAARVGPIENPLDFIAEDHMREREVCVWIDRLVAALPISKAEHGMMLLFLKDQLPQHLSDEEIDLFPLMLQRCEPEEEIGKVIDKLLSDHRHALGDAAAIAALIEAHEAGAKKFSAGALAQMTKFAHHARQHLILENAIVLPIARARLTAADLKTMRAHMLDRRETDRTPEDPKC